MFAGSLKINGTKRTLNKQFLLGSFDYLHDVVSYSDSSAPGACPLSKLFWAVVGK